MKSSTSQQTSSAVTSLFTTHYIINLTRIYHNGLDKHNTHLYEWTHLAQTSIQRIFPASSTLAQSNWIENDVEATLIQPVCARWWRTVIWVITCIRTTITNVFFLNWECRNTCSTIIIFKFFKFLFQTIHMTYLVGNHACAMFVPQSKVTKTKAQLGDLPCSWRLAPFPFCLLCCGEQQQQQQRTGDVHVPTSWTGGKHGRVTSVHSTARSEARGTQLAVGTQKCCYTSCPVVSNNQVMILLLCIDTWCIYCKA